MRTHYEFVIGYVIVASLTLYGDHDEDSDKAILLLLKESLAIAALRGGDLIVRRKKFEV